MAAKKLNWRPHRDNIDPLAYWDKPLRKRPKKKIHARASLGIFLRYRTICCSPYQPNPGALITDRLEEVTCGVCLKILRKMKKA